MKGYYLRCAELRPPLLSDMAELSDMSGVVRGSWCVVRADGRVGIGARSLAEAACPEEELI